MNETEKMMLQYLQEMLDKFMKEQDKLGKDPFVTRLFDSMIACKEMTEAIIGLPVNLQKDGKVTVGF